MTFKSHFIRGGATMQPLTAPRSWKEKQRQEREALILQVAEEVLMEKGYYETSIDEIAARVGISKGTVYLHFPSKEDLVGAIFERDTQKFLEQVETILPSALTARGKMEAILQIISGSLFNQRMQLLYSLSNSAELRRTLLGKKACMRDVWERLSARMTSVLEEGKAAGEFDSTIPTAVMLSAFFNLLLPRSYERLMVEGQMSAEEVAKYLGRIYFKGIAAI
jgi:TetR/AcrR family transcriptional regulator, fatty acid metabolism regulator protein